MDIGEKVDPIDPPPLIERGTVLLDGCTGEKLMQCCGSGSGSVTGLDLDSMGSLDPCSDPGGQK
jgi:hypothetical protein